MRFLINTYILICVMLFLFNIVFMVIKNAKNEITFSKDKNIEEIFENLLNKYNSKGEFDKSLKEILNKKIEKTNNLVEFISAFEKNRELISKELEIEIRDMIFEKNSIYKIKNEVEKAYFPYVLSIFDYADKTLSFYEKGDIIEFLECKSIYTFVNTMDLIYKLSDLELLEMAMEKLNTTEIFYHKKLLVDGLMNYEGDKDKLKKSIEEKFYSYNDAIKESLIDFCRMKKINIDKLCIDILKKEKKVYSEVRYSAMRYFMSNKCEESKEYFLNILNREDSYWVEKMLSIQALDKYYDEYIYDTIKEFVTDRNWYVRNAAIRYIHNKHVDKEELLKILEKHDKYANEELLYEYRNEDVMFEYIKDTILKFDE